MSSCASSYRAVNPQNLHFPATVETDEISFSYRYNVIQESGNKKYAKKEDKKGVDLVAVKLTNHTDQPISFRDDVELFAGDRHAYPLAPSMVYQQLKQNTPVYLLYLLLSFVQIYSVDESGEVSVFPIGLILGPGITLINVATAGTANKQFKNELQKHNLLDRTIGPGETVHGIIALSKAGYAPLSVKVKNSSLSETEY